MSSAGRYIWTLVFYALIGGAGNTVWAQGPAFNMMDTVVTMCYGQLYDSGGPDELYSGNEDLVFTIDAGVPLLCEWASAFEVEEPLGTAWFDYIVLYSGPTTASPVLDTLAGEGILPPAFSTAGALTVRFVSDGSAQRAGFHLIWEADIDPPLAATAVWNAPGSCPYNVFQLTFNQSIECSLVDWDGLELIGFEANLSTVQAMSCIGGTTSMLMFPVVGGSLNANCPIEINVDIGVRDECDSIWTYPMTAALQIDDCPPNLDIAVWTDTVCAGSCAWQEMITVGCLPTTVTWNGSDGSSFSGPGPHQLCPLETTTYTVMAVVDATGATEVLDATITVIDAQPGVQDTALCAGVVMPLLGSPAGGTWSGAGVYESAEGSGAFSFYTDSAGIGTHNITYMLPGLGCSAPWMVEVLDFEVQAYVAACPGSGGFQLDATPSGGTWLGENVDASGWFTPVFPGTFPLTYTAGTCSGGTTVTVDNIAVISDLGSICATEPADSLPTWPPGGWWSGPGVDPQTAWFDPAEVPAGPFTLIYSIEGCSQQVPGELLPIWGGWNHSSCPTQAPWVPNPWAEPAGGTWSGEGITDPLTGEFDPGGVADNSWYLLLYTAPNGCIDTTWMLNRTTRVVPTTADFCAGASEIDLNSDAIGASPWCGNWTITEGSGGTGGTPAGTLDNYDGCDWMFYPELLPTGDYVLYYEANGCTDSVEIHMFPGQLTLDSLLLCASDPGLDLGQVAGAWGGEFGASWSGTGISSAGWFDPGEAGQGLWPLAWDNPAACRDTVWIEVEGQAEIATSGLDDLAGVLCHNEAPLDFALQPSQTNWTLDGFTAEQLPSPLSTAALGEGVHTVIANWAGAVCSADSTWAFEVLPPLTAQLAAADSTLCPGTATTLGVTFGGGLFDETGGGQGALAEIIWWDGSPPYAERPIAPEVSTWVAVTVSDGCSEPATDSLYLTVLPPFDVAIDASELSCYGTPGTAALMVNSPAEVDMFWDGEPLLSSVASGIAGDSYNWALLDLQEGCSWDTIVELPGHPPVTAAFSVVPDEPCIAWTSQPVQFIDLSQFADSGSWTIGLPGGETSGFPYVYGNSPMWTFSEPGSFDVTLTVAHSSGCSDTAVQTVCILPDITLWFPDAFSPNGDGANDAFTVIGEGLLDYECHIYNRWNALVWSSSIIGESWDGIGANGQTAPVGVYVVQISARDTGGVITTKTEALRLIR